MKKQIELVRTIIAAVLIVASCAIILATIATAAGNTSPPELPTLTAPPPYPGPDPYPPPGDPYPAPYPAYLPFQADGESYP
jgi:hypothetical protein